MVRSSHADAASAGGSAWSRMAGRIADLFTGMSPPSFDSGMPTGRPLSACLRVMVVDDNPDHRMAVQELLLRRGIAPMFAADGAEAVALAGVHQFDIILMDLQMPVLDGLAASRQIRRFESTHARSRAAVVAYTSAAPAESVLGACGVDAVLEKPCSAMALEACLARWCAA